MVPAWAETCWSAFCTCNWFLTIQRLRIIECIIWTIKHFLNIFNLCFQQWMWNVIFPICFCRTLCAIQSSGLPYDGTLLYRKHSNTFRMPCKPRLCLTSWFCISKTSRFCKKFLGYDVLEPALSLSFSHPVKKSPCPCANHVLLYVIWQNLEPGKISPTYNLIVSNPF